MLAAGGAARYMDGPSRWQRAGHVTRRGRPVAASAAQRVMSPASTPPRPPQLTGPALLCRRVFCYTDPKRYTWAEGDAARVSAGAGHPPPETGGLAVEAGSGDLVPLLSSRGEGG